MSNNLTFADLRLANLARLPQFKNRHGVLTHSKPDGSDWSPAQWLQACVGELGEYANIRKKFERGDLTRNQFNDAAADEIADVLIYLDILAFQLGICLDDAVVHKFNVVSVRFGSDVRLGYAPRIYDDPNEELSTAAEEFHRATLSVCETMMSFNPNADTEMGRLLATLASAVETFENRTLGKFL